MTPRPSPPPAVAAAATGALTALYYALPDVVPSRRARGWAKAGLVAASVAASLPGARAAWSRRSEAQEADGTPSLPEAFRALPAGKKAVALVFPATLLAGGVGGMLAAERKIYRHGQARAAAGKRLPHTGPALLHGVLAAALRLMQGPPVPR